MTANKRQPKLAVADRDGSRLLVALRRRRSAD